jgi:Domain of unknown function (DUF6438)
MVLALLGAGAALTWKVASAGQTEGGLPVVELRPQDMKVWEHKTGAQAAIHLSAAEYEPMHRTHLGLESVEFEIVVSETGRVDSAKVVGDALGHEDEARTIEMARVFKPWMQDGSAVRVKVRDGVQLLPPELWADVRVPFPEGWELKSVSMRLVRTVCFGSCPDYEVRIDGDGTVRFKGNRGVMIPGDHVARISPVEVRELVEQFRKADFFSARGRYRGNWTDNPTQTVTLTIGDRTKTVVDYVGTDVGLPLAIRNLEGEIDEVAGTARWVKGDERTLASLEEEKWPFAAATKQNVALYATAISTQNRALVERYVKAGGPVVSPDINEASPVCVASASGDMGLVETMMAPDAKTGKRPNIPANIVSQCLSTAARSGNPAALQYWLDKGGDPTAPPVKTADDWTSSMGVLANAVMSGRQRQCGCC